MSSQSTASNPGFVRLFGHTGDDGSITLQAIRERANKQLAKFASLAEEQLVERQISMPPAISLVSCRRAALPWKTTIPNPMKSSAGSLTMPSCPASSKKWKCCSSWCVPPKPQVKSSPRHPAFISV